MSDNNAKRRILMKYEKRNPRESNRVDMEFALRFAKSEEKIRIVKFVPFWYINQNQINSRTVGDIMEMVYKVPYNRVGFTRYIERKGAYLGLMDERFLVKLLENIEYNHQFKLLSTEEVCEERGYG